MTGLNTPVRVAIADDSVLFREGLARVLNAAGFDVVAQAGDPDDFYADVERVRPDVAIVDIRMPPSHTTEGITIAHRIREQHPVTSVLVLSQFLEPQFAMTLLSKGPRSIGYLLKDSITNLEEFAEAVRRIARGEPVVDPAVVAQLLGRRREDNPIDALSERERQVLALVAEGRSNSSISHTLFVSSKTVEAHVSRIFVKLGLTETPDDHRRVLAVLAFLRTEPTGG
ncbi:MAG TPA: response regulator transcription factor [Mycobacterium sp.]|nr:response regulator transcription factor [Mycobacterium sp.]